MQIFGIFFGILALAVAQYPHRHRNPGFRNVQTPLSTSASKERPFLSIPIVLMPDGKIVPKPAQISYQFLQQSGNGHQPNKKRNPRTQIVSSYQVVSPPQTSYAPQQKQVKVSQNSAPTNNVRRPTMSNLPKSNNHPQQSNQNPKYIQQQLSQTSMQPPNQRNNVNPQHIAVNQPTNDAYKQNVLNFINFASHLGAQVVSQQQASHKNQMPLTEKTYGASEAQRGYENYIFEGQPTQAQADVSSIMYHQSQAQTNSASNNQQQAVQSSNHNVPQVPNQVMTAPVSLQYSQPNGRQQNQISQQQSSIQNQASTFQQNLGTNVHFPENHNNPVHHSNIYMQVPQQASPQNYVVISSQETTPNARLLSNTNYESQPQIVKSNFSPQSQMEVQNYDVNGQVRHPNYSNQNQGSQTYITSDGNQISFIPQTSPVTYAIQPSPQQHISNPTSSPTVQNNYRQPGIQKVYLAYQNPQDFSSNHAASVSLSQSNASPATQAVQQSEPSQYGGVPAQTVSTSIQNVYAGPNEQVAYRVQPQVSTMPQSAEPTTYTYGDNQQSYSTNSQKLDYSPGGGKLIYATSSAKEIHYSPSGQGYATSQLKNNEEQTSSTYVQYPNSGSVYKYDTDEDDDSETTKQLPRNESRDKQEEEQSDEDAEEDEETSYKVVYIPMDILKNILNNNNVDKRSDSQQSEKSR